MTRRVVHARRAWRPATRATPKEPRQTNTPGVWARGGSGGGDRRLGARRQRGRGEAWGAPSEWRRGGAHASLCSPRRQTPRLVAGKRPRAGAWCSGWPTAARAGSARPGQLMIYIRARLSGHWWVQYMDFQWQLCRLRSGRRPGARMMIRNTWPWRRSCAVPVLVTRGRRHERRLECRHRTGGGAAAPPVTARRVSPLPLSRPSLPVAAVSARPAPRCASGRSAAAVPVDGGGGGSRRWRGPPPPPYPFVGWQWR